jgi:SAM-dependent methyltransferase
MQPASEISAYHAWHAEPGHWGDVTRHFDSDAQLLDVGCGTAWLSRHFPNYTGIDNSETTIANARERGINAVVGDLNKPFPFDDGSFDAAIVKDLLEHVDEPAALVTDLRRVLRPGARVYACSPDAQRWVWDDYTHKRAFSRRSFSALFRDQGFTVEQVGYESVFPGVGIISARTRNHRRPLIFRLLARLRFHKRNVWILAVRP